MFISQQSIKPGGDTGGPHRGVGVGRGELGSSLRGRWGHRFRTPLTAASERARQPLSPLSLLPSGFLCYETASGIFHALTVSLTVLHFLWAGSIHFLLTETVKRDVTDSESGEKSPRLGSGFCHSCLEACERTSLPPPQCLHLYDGLKMLISCSCYGNPETNSLVRCAF